MPLNRVTVSLVLYTSSFIGLQTVDILKPEFLLMCSVLVHGVQNTGGPTPAGDRRIFTEDPYP